MEKQIKKITIVSLSRGILGEDFIKHELDIGIKRLESYGIQVEFSKHALSGLDFVAKHPELRAEDLLTAFKSDTDMILCAIGGDETYRLLPYLFDHDKLKKAVSKKVFLGYSDTTFNHFMLNKVGMKTFYGQAFLSDVCELSNEMFPYTKKYFEELINTGTISKIKPSDIWYDSRTDFSPKAIGTTPNSHENTGFELLKGKSKFKGKIFGGCIDSIYDMFDGTRYQDEPVLSQKYKLFPDKKFWKGRILLLESSEELATPEKYQKMIQAIKSTGIFNVINGILIGKPVDEKYFYNYKNIILEETKEFKFPIVANINIGHSTPRCIIPFGKKAIVDTKKQEIKFK